MSLEEQLNAFREQVGSVVPPEALATVRKQIEDWMASGIWESALKIGDSAPEFTLLNIDGKTVSSKMLLDKGPMVLHFFRGKW